MGLCWTLVYLSFMSLVTGARAIQLETLKAALYSTNLMCPYKT